MHARGFYSLLILSALSFLSCRQPSSQSPRVIVIQPFGGFPPSRAALVYKELKRIDPQTTLKAAIPLPTAAYYPVRDRYRADSLIRFLNRFGNGDTVVIGLTDKDISTTKGSIKDWGVMGLGYCPGNACIISTYRLSRLDQDSQFYKLALHELGHTQGLPHCLDKTCFMRDAEGGNPLNEEKGFCLHCKRILIGKGWRIQ